MGGGRGGRVAGQRERCGEKNKGERRAAVKHRYARYLLFVFSQCLEASGNSYKGVQVLCLAGCLYQSQGRVGEDLSLLVGISGSDVWL